MAHRKPIRFTRHAEDAIVERDLDRGWIERAIEKPEWVQDDPRRMGVERRFRRIPEFDDRVLRVACIETEDEIRVLTVFFDRDARKPS